VRSRPRLAAFKKHGTEIVVGFEKPHGRITVPESQAFDLLFALHVRHTEFQHRGLPGRERYRPNPRATRLVAIKWNTEPE
jgi:hypothetical protein